MARQGKIDWFVVGEFAAFGCLCVVVLAIFVVADKIFPPTHRHHHTHPHVEHTLAEPNPQPLKETHDD